MSYYNIARFVASLPDSSVDKNLVNVRAFAPGMKSGSLMMDYLPSHFVVSVDIRAGQEIVMQDSAHCRKMIGLTHFSTTNLISTTMESTK